MSVDINLNENEFSNFDSFLPIVWNGMRAMNI